MGRDLSKVYHSKKIRDGVRKTADLIGVSGGAVLPMCSYSDQTETHQNIDLLAASVLQKVLNAVDDRIGVLVNLEDSSEYLAEYVMLLVSCFTVLLALLLYWRL